MLSYKGRFPPYKNGFLLTRVYIEGIVFNWTLYLMNKLIRRLEEVTITVTLIKYGRNMDVYINPRKYESVALRVPTCAPLGGHK